MATEKGGETAKRVARKACAAKGKFAQIDESVREMSRQQGEERFGVANHIELMTYYERGAILDHGKRVWFEKDEPGYQNWVLTSLRVPLDVANRHRRAHLAMLHSGLDADDFKGISLSSVLLLLPILRHLQSEGIDVKQRERYKAYREAMPKLLELARTGTVQEVKAQCYALRGMKLQTGARDAREIVRLGDWVRSVRALGYIGNEFGRRETPFAFFTRDPETGMFHSFISKNFIGDDGFAKAWKEQCIPVLKEATKHFQKEAEEQAAEESDEAHTLVEYADELRQLGTDS